MMVAAGQVQSGKELGPNQRIERLTDPRKSVCIAKCLCVESTIIHTEADASIFLADYDHWCSIRTVAFDDDLL